jgi:hypothetical protein
MSTGAIAAVTVGGDVFVEGVVLRWIEDCRRCGCRLGAGENSAARMARTTKIAADPEETVVSVFGLLIIASLNDHPNEGVGRPHHV